jgi:chromosome partitioning protein
LSDYDNILIDTPPTLGLLTINALAAADNALIPVSTQLLSLRGLATLIETIEKVKRYEINAGLSILGIVPTKYDRRTIHAREVLSYLTEVGTQVNAPIFPPIRSTVRFDEATNLQTPFVVLYPDDEATHAYKEIASYVQQKARA